MHHNDLGMVGGAHPTDWRLGDQRPASRCAEFAFRFDEREGLAGFGIGEATLVRQGP
jgi:hypothetical protein